MLTHVCDVIMQTRASLIHNDMHGAFSGAFSEPLARFTLAQIDAMLQGMRAGQLFNYQGQLAQPNDQTLTETQLLRFKKEIEEGGNSCPMSPLFQCMSKRFYRACAMILIYSFSHTLGIYYVAKNSLAC